MIKIRKFTKKDTENAALLMIEVYKKFNLKEATKKGIDDFVNFLHPDKVPSAKLYTRLNKPIFFIAKDKQKIIGLIRGTPDKISSLFIHGNYQKQGLGKKLIELYEIASKKQNSKSIKVRASLLAVPFYKKMGFKKTTGLRMFQGMKMYPMKKELNKMAHLSHK